MNESQVDSLLLREAVAGAFAAAGALARADVHYRPREAQQAMALAVALAIGSRGTLVVEAGTGVGKTFAYLVPALLSGERVLISTATKNLQDQLFLRDLPRLRDALRSGANIALLKGRGSYLCLHRLEQARSSGVLPDRPAVRTLARVEQWAQATTSGDLAEIDGLDERSPVVALVTSTRENCLGTECPEHRACHVMKARRDAMAADVVVVNHHLFFADVVLRDSGVAELLPTVGVAVFDEAHQLADAGIQFLGTTLSSGQLVELSRDLLASGLSLARGLLAWSDVAGGLEHAARVLRLAVAGPLQNLRAALKLRWDERSGKDDFDAALGAVDAACDATLAALEQAREIAPDFDRLAARVRDASALARRFGAATAPGQVRWIDLTPHQVRLVESPLDIREALREQMKRAPKSWVFTSATLGDDERLSWFTEGAGLDEAAILRVGSPFDYTTHARLYVPRRFPKPNEPAHAREVARLAARCARALGGRCFVLTTTLRALRAIGEALSEEFEAHDDGIEVLVQGSAPKRALLARFLETHGQRSAGGAVPASTTIAASGRATPRRGALLVGSQSFWEGIDVPGDALQCVVIDKLPFPPPNDPLVEARVRRLESLGRNAFTDYFVAEAAVSLKQGAGRLIRSESDRGLLAICDPRLASMNYGRRLREALPAMTPLDGEDEALAWLEELARSPA